MRPNLTEEARVNRRNSTYISSNFSLLEIHNLKNIQKDNAAS